MRSWDKECGKMNYKRITDLPGVRIAREAMVVGDVTIGEDSCVLFYSTVRGDEGTITIGSPARNRTW